MREAKHHRVRVALAFSMVYVLWGATYLAMRVAVEHIHPFVMGSVRYGIAGTVMLAWCAFSGRKIRITRHDALRLLVLGVLLLSIANMSVAISEQYLSSGLAALIVACVPIWVAMIEAWIFRNRRLSLMGLAGLGLGVLGMLVLLWPRINPVNGINGSHLDRLQLFGFGILLVASASWSLGSVLSGRFALGVDVLTASAWEMTFAGIVNTVVALLTGGFHQVVWTSRGMFALTYLVICGSWIGFTAYIWLLEHVPTPKVATYAYVNPVVAVYLGWLFLDEKVDAWMLIGTVIIISAVVLVNMSKLRTMKDRIAAEEVLAVEPAGD